MNIGFIYLLSNQCMPGLCKIGFTTRHPISRMHELSATSSCATPFEMLAFFDCENPALVEKSIHRRLEKYRVNPAREFFHLNPHVLGDVIRDYADQRNIWWFGPLDHLCNTTDYTEEAA